jgi:hypothetical protein
MKKIEWILRIGVFGTFLGHGLLAASIQPNWINYLNMVGFSDDMAIKIMPVIGSIDILVALIILIRPLKPVIIYATLWAFLTALMRPISGEPILEFVERTANWAVPLALYFVLYKKSATDN